MEDNIIIKGKKVLVLLSLSTVLISWPVSNAFANISANSRCDFVTFLGDSNTNLWYLRPNIALQHPKLSQDYRYTAIVDRNLPVPVFNLGQGGAKTEDMLPGRRYGNWDSRSANRKHGIYIIAFGLNDHKQFSTRFNSNWNLALRNYWNKTRQLIKSVKNKGGIPVLMTMPPVDFPRHHHYDRNKITDRYNSVYRNLSKSENIPLFDINAHFKALFRNNVWDIHIRNTSYTSGKYVLDKSKDSGRTNPNWFSNIHYNLNGSKKVAAFLTRKLRNIGCGRKNLSQPDMYYASTPQPQPPVPVHSYTPPNNTVPQYDSPYNDSRLSTKSYEESLPPHLRDEFTVVLDD